MLSKNEHVVAARTLTSACSGRHLALLGAAAEAGVGQIQAYKVANDPPRSPRLLVIRPREGRW